MDGLVHKKVIKVNGKVVLEQAQRLSGSASGGDEAKKPRAKMPDISEYLDLMESRLRMLRDTPPNRVIEQAAMQGAVQRMLVEVARLKAPTDTRKAESVPSKVEKKPDALLRQAKAEVAAGENALHKEIHETRQRLRQRQQQLQELGEADAKLEERLRLQILEHERKKKKLEEDEAVAKAQQQKQKDRLVELQNELLQNKKRVLELQDDIKRQTEFTDELRQTVNDGERNIAALKETLEKHIGEEQRLHEHLAGAEATLEKQRDRLLELETTLSEQRTRVDETGCRRQRLEVELHNLRESLSPHEEQLKLMEQLLAETKDVVGILEGTVADNRRKEAKLTKAKEETEANHQLLEKKIAEMNILVNRRAEEHKKLETRANASFRESAKLKEEEVQKKNEIETLKRRDAVLRAELQQLTTGHKRLELNVEKLREHVGGATREKEQAQAQLDAVLHELFRQTEKEAAAKAELDALRDRSAMDLTAAREEICGLEEELAQARDKQQSLEVDLEQQREVEGAAVVSSEKIQIKKKKGWFAKKKQDK